MGRLEHLKQTLPTQKHPDCESVVVDWSCPDNCGDWLEANHPWAKVVRVENKRFYGSAASRNAGLEVATGEYVCNADADVIFNPSFFSILDLLTPQTFLTRIPTRCYVDPDYGDAVYKKDDKDEPRHRWVDEKGIVNEEKGSLTGFVVFPRTSVLDFGGYDTRFNRAVSGGEDIDIRFSLLLTANLEENLLEGGHFDSISHSNDIRTQFLLDKKFSSARRGGAERILQKWKGAAYKTLAKKYGLLKVTS